MMLAQVSDVAPIDEKEYQQIYQDAAAKVLNETVDDTKFQDQGQGVFWRNSFAQPKTRYIRFRFDHIMSPQGLRYRVRILREPAEEEVASYTGDEFARDESFMTGLLPPGHLRIELVSEARPQGLSFRLERALWQAKSTEAKPQTPVLKFKYIRTLPENSPPWTVAPTVARLHIGPMETSCTGVLVDQGTVATNYHCMQASLSFLTTEQTAKPSCHDILAEFDYLTADQRGPTARCLAVRTDKQLDVALLTFAPEAIRTTSGQERRPIQLRPADEGAPQVVTLIHHPLGLPLVVEENCSLTGVDQVDLLHDCLSTSGSSGSPLFDEKMRWVGLHYKGAYPSKWTIERLEEDFTNNGPRYNRARASTVVSEFIKK
jgi:hypothetical protein